MLEINKPQTPEVRNAIELLRSRMNVGRMIVEYRVRLGLTQEQIAKDAGTKQSRVSELETLSGNLRFDTLDRIAKALGLEVTLQPRTTPLATFTVTSADDQRVRIFADAKYQITGTLFVETGSLEMAYPA
jgi:transcriptional regulator with XRE-family HTH domain